MTADDSMTALPMTADHSLPITDDDSLQMAAEDSLLITVDDRVFKVHTLVPRGMSKLSNGQE